LFDKKKGKLFFTVFFRVLKRAVLSRVRRVEGGGHENKKTVEKSFFFFIKHEVLFYETPFLHRTRRIYVCGATALARPHLEEVSSSGGLSLEFWD
jgi:hypothetical protein